MLREHTRDRLIVTVLGSRNNCRRQKLISCDSSTSPLTLIAEAQASLRPVEPPPPPAQPLVWDPKHSQTRAYDLMREANQEHGLYERNAQFAGEVKPILETTGNVMLDVVADSTPILGTITTTSRLGFGYDILRDQGVSGQQRATEGALIVAPFALGALIQKAGPLVQRLLFAAEDVAEAAADARRAEQAIVRAGSPKLAAVPNDPKVYSVAFATRLKEADFGLSRSEHFRIANEALQAERAANPALAELVPKPRRWGRPPAGWSWQHATIDQAGGRAGVLELVPRAQHTPGSSFWRLFHPLPGGAGGYAQWAIPAGAPPN